MRMLVTCECSGEVREAFRARGHGAWSCDLLESEIPGQHIVGDVLGVIGDGWDLMIAHPPCTHLAVSGARWWKDKAQEQADALEFVRALMAAPIDRIALENPISKISSAIRKPDQIVQPWQYGHGETKATCLWLKGLPKLQPMDVVAGREPKVHHMAPGPNRWRAGSRTYSGIGRALAQQGGNQGGAGRRWANGWSPPVILRPAEGSRPTRCCAAASSIVGPPSRPTPTTSWRGRSAPVG